MWGLCVGTYSMFACLTSVFQFILEKYFLNYSSFMYITNIIIMQDGGHHVAADIWKSEFSNLYFGCSQRSPHFVCKLNLFSSKIPWMWKMELLPSLSGFLLVRTWWFCSWKILWPMKAVELSYTWVSKLYCITWSLMEYTVAFLSKKCQFPFQKGKKCINSEKYCKIYPWRFEQLCV